MNKALGSIYLLECSITAALNAQILRSATIFRCDATTSISLLLLSPGILPLYRVSQPWNHDTNWG